MSVGKNDVKTDDNSFAKRHPRINAILGLLILSAFLFLAGVIVFFVIKNCIKGIKSLINVASNLDAVVIVALITGGVSILSVLISSIIGKIIEYKNNRQSYLCQKREKPYCDFIEMVYKIQLIKEKKYSNDEMARDMLSFSKELTLWGSSKVVNKWNVFREKSKNTEEAANNIFLLEEIMNEMRKDMGCKKVKKGDLLGLFINDIKEVLKR